MRSRTPSKNTIRVNLILQKIKAYTEFEICCRLIDKLRLMGRPSQPGSDSRRMHDPLLTFEDKIK